MKERTFLLNGGFLFFFAGVEQNKKCFSLECCCKNKSSQNIALFTHVKELLWEAATENEPDLKQTGDNTDSPVSLWARVGYTPEHVRPHSHKFWAVRGHPQRGLCGPIIFLLWKIFFGLLYLYFLDRAAEEQTGKRGEREGSACSCHKVESNPGPLQRGHSLCMWGACSTDWATV